MIEVMAGVAGRPQETVVDVLQQTLFAVLVNLPVLPIRHLPRPKLAPPGVSRAPIIRADAVHNIIQAPLSVRNSTRQNKRSTLRFNSLHR